MNAVKSIYKDAPSTIPVPTEFQHKDIEVIFLPIEKPANQFLNSIPTATDEEMEDIIAIHGEEPGPKDVARTETLDL
jgi:hypothetical protein